ncbi:MAG: beta-ketoacyl-ACP synthase II [Clostridiaceae bacterium]
MIRRVVVTGIGVLTPIGKNVPEFLESLKNGVHGIAPITKFDTSEYKATLAAELKGYNPSDYFDKSDWRKLDPFSQYAMIAAKEAMEDSGLLEAEFDHNRAGVFIGSGIGGLETTLEAHKTLLEKGPRRVSPFTIPSMISNMAAGQVAIKYDFRGENLPVVTACATSTHAIGEAMRSIRHGYSDIIMAGGAEASINGLSVAAFTSSMALTLVTDPDRASIPFDLNRAGFVMAEGAGVVVLEEMEHAIKRGAKIYGEVTGYGNTCDAHHITAPAPGGDGAYRAITAALKENGAYDVEKTYYNAHGTSTGLNDKTETEAIKKSFGEDAYKLSISSTKSMTGHMLGAAGAVEAVASLLAMKYSFIPPTVGLKDKDPECDLNYTPGTAVHKEVDTAISTSLGFGGHNAAVMFKKVK